MKHLAVTRALVAIVGAMLASTAPVDRVFAQTAYPTHPVRIIVPFPPGGPADALARLTGDRLSRSLAQPFVVALGVASPRRIASAPHLPTIAEQGLPGFDVTSWYALVAPAGTPASIIDRLHQEIAKALAEPDVREKIAGLGAEPVGNTPVEFAAMQRAEAARWAKLARESNIRAD
jgi:tripartite-type tricarboxylate transporter receptor subunit TctC